MKDRNGKRIGRCVVTETSKKQNRIPSADEKIESNFPFDVFTEGDKGLGWLLTFTSSLLEDQHSCVDLYFVREDGTMFKAKYKFRPYFYVALKDNMEVEVDAYLRRRYQGQIADIQIVEKQDLEPGKHLSGLLKTYLKITFDTAQQQMHVKSDLMLVVERNQDKCTAAEAHKSVLPAGKGTEPILDFTDCIYGLSEYDEPYHVRFAIDNGDIRSGRWYDVDVSRDGVTLKRNFDLRIHAEVHVCAFNIMTTKLPGGDHDLVKMVSYMVDSHGYLIVNRQCVDKDIDDLKHIQGKILSSVIVSTDFTVTNANNEEELIRSWFSHMIEVKPGIYVTYDSSDWQLIENRAADHGLRMNDELKFAFHLDCFAWVKHDVFNTQGSHSLKDVVAAQLHYVLKEVTAEEMTRLTVQDPQEMAYHSVSDVVSTYHLYMNQIHCFLFNLTTLIPMPPDEVLRGERRTICKRLPNKFKLLPELFESMVSSVRMLKLQRKDPIFRVISRHVEALRGRELSLKNLAQMKYILPGAIETKSVNVRNNNTCCMEPDIKVSVSFDIVRGHNEVSDGVALSSLFCSKLLDIIGIFGKDPGFDVPEDDI